MAGRSRVAASALLGVVTFLGSPVAARAQRAADLSLPVVTRVAILAPGEPGAIAGIVRNEQGDPIGGAVVSALGATTNFAVTDALGHYEITTLNPGPYLLRAHSRGYVAPRAQMVEIRSNVRLASSFAMRRADDRPQVLAAGIGALAVERAGAPPSPSVAPLPSRRPRPPLLPLPRTDDDHSETAWRLRHARRSVLKDALFPADLFEDDGLDTSLVGDFLGRAVSSPARAATSFFSDTAFSGQVNLLTTSAFDTPEELLTGNNLARGIAYLSLGAPAGDHARLDRARRHHRRRHRVMERRRFLQDPRGAPSPLRRRDVLQRPALRRRQSARAARCPRRQPQCRHGVRIRHVRPDARGGRHPTARGTRTTTTSTSAVSSALASRSR